ncbi:hypothetical protein DV736_g428, partial [Chaetothyriales sp. CBS 134916]
MDEYTADIFANDDEPLAGHSLNDNDVQLGVRDAEAEMSQGKMIPPYSGNHIIPQKAATNVNIHPKSTTTMENQSLQDRLFSRLLQQVIPPDGNVNSDGAIVDQASSIHVPRPVFSLPIMTSNFRRFNARIGVVFVFQDQVIHLFSWKHPSHTLSFLATYSFVCLNPYLLAALPLAITLLFVMVPAFLSRHPPPPPQATTSSTTAYYSTYDGPALAPARTIKPASETSVDFFRNIRYLQNSMADFANLYDLVNSTIIPATNFSNEILSSTIFICLFVLTLFLFITAHLLPWRLIALVGGNAAIVSLHPVCQEWLLKLEERVNSQSQASQQPTTAGTAQPHVPQKLQPLISSLSSITLSSTPETREVEIFELQHRQLSSFSSSSVTEWRPYLFTPTPYDPLSPARISGDRPKGTRFFEDVQPPEGWEFYTKKWELDMDAGEWVNERLVVGVEYDVLNKAEDDEDDDVNNDKAVGQSSGGRDFGGWVWDLPPAPGQDSRDEEVWLPYGDYGLLDHEQNQAGRKDKDGTSEKDWEESVRYGNNGRTGEWRRRRWVRLVRRKWVSDRPETRDIFGF